MIHKKIELRRQLLILASSRQYEFAHAYRNIVVVKVDSLYKKGAEKKEKGRNIRAFFRIAKKN